MSESLCRPMILFLKNQVELLNKLDQTIKIISVELSSKALRLSSEKKL